MAVTGPLIATEYGSAVGCLPVVVVDVEHPTLNAGVTVVLEVEHRRFNPIDVKGAGSGETAKTAPRIAMG
jgi:hypothetical protein